MSVSSSFFFPTVIVPSNSLFSLILFPDTFSVYPFAAIIFISANSALLVKETFGASIIRNFSSDPVTAFMVTFALISVLKMIVPTSEFFIAAFNCLAEETRTVLPVSAFTGTLTNAMAMITTANINKILHVFLISLIFTVRTSPAYVNILPVCFLNTPAYLGIIFYHLSVYLTYPFNRIAVKIIMPEPECSYNI